MQIIQHVKRGYGQPTSPPEEIGIHYIDVVTNELYISRGKISVNDWGEPLSAALVPGSNGLVFGWSDASGQTWYVLDKLGVEEDAVLTKDSSMIVAAASYANTSVEGLINLSLVTNGDNETLSGLQAYTDALLGNVVGTPAGGDAGGVLSKTSNADRDAGWIYPETGEVLSGDVSTSSLEITGAAGVEISELDVMPSPSATDGDLFVRSEWTTPSHTSVYSIVFEQTDQMQLAHPVRFKLSIDGQVYESKDNATIHVVYNSDMTYTVPSNTFTWITVPTTAIGQFQISVAVNGVLVLVEECSIRAAYNVAKLAVVKDGDYASTEATFDYSMESVGGLDDVVGYTLTITNPSQGAVVHELPAELSSFTVPASLTAGQAYEASIIAHGKWNGDSAPTSFMFITRPIERFVAFPGLVVSGAMVYTQDEDTFTKIPDPVNVTNVRTGAGTVFLNNGTELAISHPDGGNCTLYNRVADQLSNPRAIIMQNYGRGLAASPDGEYLTGWGNFNPYTTTRKRDGGSWTSVTMTNNVANTPISIAYDSTGEWMAGTAGVFRSSTNTLTGYPYFVCKRTSPTQFGSITPLTGYTVPAQTNTWYHGYGVSWLGDLLVFGLGFSPYIVAFKRSGNTFTKINPFVGTFNTTPTALHFSPTGEYLLMGTNGADPVRLIKVEGDTLTMLPAPAVSPGSCTVLNCSFSPDGRYAAARVNIPPYNLFYRRDGDALVKLPTPAVVPASDVGFWGAGNPPGGTLGWYYS